MIGQNLYNAAQIVSKAGSQIDSIIETISEMFVEKLKNVGHIRDYTETDDDNYSPGGWLLSEYFYNIWLIPPKKRNARSHIGVHVVLSDDDIPGLKIDEPIIFIMYGQGKDAFEIESLAWILSDEFDGIIKNGKAICWAEEGEKYDSWMFALPLVKLNSENDINQHIVQPAVNFIISPKALEEFPQDSIACSFYHEDGSVICRASQLGG